MKYFKHELLSRDDDKVFELIEIHGLQAYGLWWVILEELYKAEERGFQIPTSDIWFKRLAKAVNLTDWRTLIRILDTMSDLGLISSQLWAEHVIFAPGIEKRADQYIKQKQLANDRKRRHREKPNPESEKMERVPPAFHSTCHAGGTPIFESGTANIDPDPDPDPDPDQERSLSLPLSQKTNPERERDFIDEKKKDSIDEALIEFVIQENPGKKNPRSYALTVLTNSKEHWEKRYLSRIKGSVVSDLPPPAPPPRFEFESACVAAMGRVSFDRDARQFVLSKLRAAWDEGWHDLVKDLCSLYKDWGFIVTDSGVKEASG